MMTTRFAFRRFSLIALLAACYACSGSDSPGTARTGGTKAAGGMGASGGASPTGGTPGTGGINATGGAVGTGGLANTGGVSTTGGIPRSGGLASTGGLSATGGGGASGGTATTGGTVVTGGTARLGGSVATGGVAGTGGSMGTGGAPDAGAPDTRIADTAMDSRAPDTAKDTAVNTNTVVTVYIAGDSTVSTYTNSAIKQGGWGQFLQSYFIANAKIVNKAVGGMTARHYIEAGYLDQILATIKAGDYLLVQFGTNDGNKTATYELNGQTIPYYLAPDTDFKTYLTKYVDATKAKGATTLFVTPPPRHSCSGTDLGVANGLGAYADAMKALAPTLNTKVADLNAMTVTYLSTIACDVSGKTFYLVKADGTIDSTHFQENGANIMAGLVAKGSAGISTLGLPLSAYVK